MGKPYRRFEFLLPRRFNDLQPVPQHLITETLSELEQRFGADSAETQVIHGRWRHEDRSYRDEMFCVFVDVPDTPENCAFFSAFKEVLRERFQQIDMWMTTFPVEVL